ncbi:hypothetical protein EVAR_6348_1 [Eumeta japonica]|uniref:Uncharacterized protein n=1 Tax=Eumeta variegata TaxID=151549 RepID=A0A4C1TCG2_EUMVA|nr:hypothetical protein EVAR_6348_1 [Eumeta japonica]
MEPSSRSETGPVSGHKSRRNRGRGAGWGSSVDIKFVGIRCNTDETARDICLQCFADLSEAGYGVAVYLRVVGFSGGVKLSLMMAKSQVAPIKSKLTIPELERCGATLVIKILDNVLYSIRDNVEVHDMTFEENRLSRIIDSGFKIKWRHLSSQMNPADVVSRGCNGAELLTHPLWWGPEWLQNTEKFWP